METLLDPKPLFSEKPDKVGRFTEQVCMRCGKRPALPNDVYCSVCLGEIAQFEALTKARLKENKEDRPKPSPIKYSPEDNKELDEFD